MLKQFFAGTVLLILSGLFAASAQEVDPSLYSGLEARLVGPAGMSGRIAAVDAVADDPNHIVVGASTGGVWISENGGLNWTPVFDDQPVASIGAVAINQTNPDIIWVGTGEGNVRNSTSVGGGVFKSLDGGQTWTHVGLEGTERIHRIALHPTNPDVAYIAALGPLWSAGEDRGLYRTTDGGESWEKILYVNDSTGATDIRMMPGNPQKLFAGMWEFRRWPYFFKSGGEGSGLYVSHDGGDNWTELTEDDGLPKGELGRSSFAMSPADPKRVYALIEAEESALARSDDGGRSWTLVNTDFDINDRPFYYGDLAVDPQNANRVYRIGSRVKVSEDGGKTFEYMPAIDCCAASNTVHIDTHAWWINPNDPRHMIDGNDGGIAITHDRGETWRFVRNLPLAQFYHIAVDNEVPYNILGGLQDNGSWRGPSEVFENGGIRNFHWQEVAFGDGFDTRADPENANRGYAMSQGGVLYRWDLDSGESRLIKPDPVAGTDLRFNWNAGFAQDPFDPATIYLGSQFVHKSTDRGLTWQVVSGDLTTNNPDVQTFRESGGLTPDVTAAENYTSITMIAPSPLEEGVIWVGSDDGRVHVSRNAGEDWQSVEGRLTDGPDGAWVPMIYPSPHDASVAFIVLDDHRNGDMTPYAYRLENYGRTWVPLVDGAVSGYATSILQDSVDPDLLFLGTEFGLHISHDGGRRWMKWTQGVPTVQIADLALQARESDLIVGTHGRAAFVIEDIAAIRNLSARNFSERFALLNITHGQQYRPAQTPSTRFTGSGEFRASNAPYGVMITFMASGSDLTHPDKERERARAAAARRAAGEDKDDVSKPLKATITVMNAAGETIRTFKTDVHQGINRAVWNLRRDGLRPVSADDAPKDGTLPAGREVVPGTYTVRIAFDGRQASGAIEVLADPRSPYSLDAQVANAAALDEVEALQERMNGALRNILAARRDVETVETLIKAETAGLEPDAHPYADLEAGAKALKDALTEAETRFRVPPETRGIVFSADKVGSQIGTAAFYLGSTFDGPSSAALAELDRARVAVDQAITSTNDVLNTQLADFRTAVEAAGLGLLNQSPVTQTP
jgi:photosystem II stability/assembly factor-like uncharacterized protein